MALLKENDLYKLEGTDQERKVKLSVVHDKFWESEECMKKEQKSYGVKIPRWWKEQCLQR